MPPLKLITTSLALAAAFIPPAQAALVNGGFEAGLSGWATWGDASTTGAAPAGSAQLLLTTAGLAAEEFDAGGNPIGPFNASGNAPVLVGVPGGLEALTGLPLDSLNPAGDFAVEGSAAGQTFTASAGQTLSFLWNFGTRDTFADYGFVAIDGVVIRLGGVADAVLPGTGNSLLETGDASFTHTFGSSGPHSLVFGVVDVADSAVTSFLSVDQVILGNAVPEPQTAALMLMALGLLAVRSRRLP